MTTCRDTVSSIDGCRVRSGGPVDVEATGGQRFSRLQRRRIAIERRTVGADLFVVVAHVEEYVRVIERRVGTDAHEFLDADVDSRVACIVLEMGNGTAGHLRLRLNSVGLAAFGT